MPSKADPMLPCRAPPLLERPGADPRITGVPSETRGLLLHGVQRRRDHPVHLGAKDTSCKSVVASVVSDKGFSNELPSKTINPFKRKSRRASTAQDSLAVVDTSHTPAMTCPSTFLWDRRRRVPERGVHVVEGQILEGHSTMRREGFWRAWRGKRWGIARLGQRRVSDADHPARKQT